LHARGIPDTPKENKSKCRKILLIHYDNEVFTFSGESSMEAESFALFVALEMVLLSGGALFLLYRKYVLLRKRLDEQPAPVAEPATFDSIESGYFPYLEKELLATHACLEQIRNSADVDEIQVQALENRVNLLEAEKQVVESSNDYPDRHWEFVLESFKPVPEELDQTHESGDAETVEDTEADQHELQADADSQDIAEEDQSSGSDAQVEVLQDNMRQQGIVLDDIRQALQQVRQDPQAEAIEKLEQQLKKLEQRYREASTCIDIMGQENDRLQEKIDHRDHRIGLVEAEKTESVADLEEQLDKQKRSVSELHSLVDGLQLETEKANQLQNKLDQFELASRDMNMCIQVLEEENQFLQEQIAALLKADDGESVYDKAGDNNELAELQAQIEILRKELVEKDKKIREAEDRFTAMEQEYLTLYEEANA
jgi:chromosome segregation ATPase